MRAAYDADVEEALATDLADEVKAECAIIGAATLADLGRLDEALTMLRRIETRPDVARRFDLRVWYETGDVLARLGRRMEAAAEFLRVLRHDPAAFDAADRIAALRDDS